METQVTETQAVHPNMNERNYLGKLAYLLGFKDKMPRCKSLGRPECEAGYVKRFGNWRSKLMLLQRETDLAKNNSRR